MIVGSEDTFVRDNALYRDDFTNAVKSFSLSWFIIKKLNNDNYNKCIIYKSPTFVHRIYTYQHYSTFI